ncbi:MAG: hypothetical protein N2258_07810 [Brevinematales bacterium]|nr:hypothetical protein [Brevinematales bacterium]
MKKYSYFLLIFFFLSGCLEKSEFMSARFVKPEEARRYKSKGVLVFASVDKENAPYLAYLYLMIKNSQDITYVVNQDFSLIVFDVNEKANGYDRVGIRYQAFGIDFWLNKPIDFKLETNKLNYLGRMIFYAKDSFKPYRMIITNLLDEDLKNLAEFYPDLTNMEIHNVGIKEGLYNFY